MAHPPVDAPEVTAAQARALSHPARVRLWSALGEGDATISQLSNRLGLNKGSVSHHLGVLVAAGLARSSLSRTVRGGTEKYFTRTSTRLVFPAVAGGGGPGGAMMQRVLEDVATAEDLRVHQRSIRLTPAQAWVLTEHLDELLHSLEPADERHRTYEVVTAVYRCRRPPAPLH